MKKKALIAVGLFVVLLLGLAALALYNGSKSSNPYPDLAVLPRNIAENKNGFLWLEKAIKAIRASNYDLADATHLLREDTDWNTERAAEILEQNEEALTFLKQSAQFQISVPPIQSLDEDFSYLRDWWHLAQLQLLESRYLFERGDEKQSFALLRSLLEGANRMQDGGGVAVHYSNAMGIKKNALSQWTNLLEKASLDCETLSRYGASLNSVRPDFSGFTNTVKHQFQLGIKALGEIERGQLPDTTNSRPVRVLTAIGVAPFLNRPKTEGILAVMARSALASANRPYCVMPIHSTAQTNFATSGAMDLLLKGNAVGRIAGSTFLPDYERFLSRMCLEDFNISVLQTLIALRCHLQKTGSLPPNLESLVPEYLPSIPLDPFDGKPIRYSLEKKIIYSVGRDGVDSGGIEKDGKNVTLDYVVPINFQERSETKEPLQDGAARQNRLK